LKWFDALSGSERRRAPRQAHPGILVYYWDGSTPRKHQVRDCSLLGAFVKTPERWYIGTLVRLTLVLDRGNPGEIPESESISMFAKAVRHEDDGVGVEFVTPHAQERAKLREFLARASSLPPRTQAANAAEGGQALVEFALVLPLILLLVVNAFNFGGFLYAWITISNAARSGVQYYALSGASVGNVSTPTTAQVRALVTKEVSSLPNASSLQVTVCTIYQISTSIPAPAPTYTCDPSTPANPAPGETGNEAPYYMQTSVDVTYTYKPFIPLWDFNALGIHATLPATTVHRQAIMRRIS